jgi:hypothetical protein
LDEQVRLAGGDLVGVPGLGVQGAGDEQDPGEGVEHLLDGVEQRRERRDFVRFRVHGDLGGDESVVVSRADSRCT